MTDLNTLIPSNSPLHLTYGAGINNGGEIAGSADDQTIVTNPAFLAVPFADERRVGEAWPRCRQQEIARASLSVCLLRISERNGEFSALIASQVATGFASLEVRARAQGEPV